MRVDIQHPFLITGWCVSKGISLEEKPAYFRGHLKNDYFILQEGLVLIIFVSFKTFFPMNCMDNSFVLSWSNWWEQVGIIPWR